MRKMHGTGAIKRAAKRTAKKLNVRKAPSREHGKAVMKDDPRKPGRKMGYATAKPGMKAEYKYKKKRPTSTASKRSTRKKMY